MSYSNQVFSSAKQLPFALFLLLIDTSGSTPILLEGKTAT